ncbi:unnamed protein product [Medioppia subpectinata]|uniref:Uncharacterized protein n=1 Tax=Medioppia subpectinata TaxID=1979941 RepID=A0A7R9KQU0_9ACAR|nr:unnamed protein product [Medioppia subpectinata]CAG2108128.1 unnamed protein product [Medioppia subpectinata]
MTNFLYTDLSVSHVYSDTDARGETSGANLVGNRRQIVINTGNGANGGKGGAGGAGRVRHSSKDDMNANFDDFISDNNIKTGYKQTWIHNRYSHSDGNGYGVLPNTGAGNDGQPGVDGTDGQSSVVAVIN